MNIEHYRDRLLDFERDLSARTERELADGRREFIDSAAASEKFTQLAPIQSVVAAC